MHCVVRSRIPSDPVPRLSSGISVRWDGDDDYDDDDDDNPQEQAGILSSDVRRARYRVVR